MTALGVAPWGETLAELVDAGRHAEAAGATTVWVPEMHRSASIALAAMAQTTSSARVGSAIMLAFVRSPMTIALEALDLDELSGGRLVLGLGSGVQRLNEDWHGVHWERPVRHLGEVVRNVRAFVSGAHRGEPIDLEGLAPMRIRGYEIPGEPVRTAIPIHLAAVGPQMTRLAGRVSDGWIAHELGSPAYLRQVVFPALEAGLRAGGRDRSSLEIVVSACCVVDDDEAQARRWAAGPIAFYASVHSYEPFFAFHGFAAEVAAVREHFRAGDFKGMVECVPDAMVDALTFAGSAERVRERLRVYDGLADSLKLSPPMHLVPAVVTRHTQANLIGMLGDMIAAGGVTAFPRRVLKSESRERAAGR